jgi:flagellar biogenesis protein FliO
MLPRRALILLCLLHATAVLRAQSADVERPSGTSGARPDPWEAIAPDIPKEEPRVVRRGQRPQATSRPAAPQGLQSSWVRTAGSLALVVGLIVLLAWGYRTVAGATPWNLAARPRKPGLIEVVSRTALTPRHALYLVRVGPRLALLGVSGDQMRALDVVADADVAAVILGQAAGQRGDSSRAAFEQTIRDAAEELVDAGDADGADSLPSARSIRSADDAVRRAMERLKAAARRAS